METAPRQLRRHPYVTPGTLRGEPRQILVVPASSSHTGKMRREYFKTAKEAERALDGLERAIRNRGKQAASAPAVLVNDALKAQDALTTAGVTSSLDEVVRDWLTIRAKETKSVTVRAAVADWLNNPRHHRRERTQKELKRIGTHMERQFGDEILCNLKVSEVHAHFEKCWKTPINFNFQLQRLRGLFGHAERRGWCSARLIRDIYQPKSVPRRDHDIGTLEPEDFATLLKEAEDIDSALVDYLAVLGLAGVRPAEAERLSAQHFQRKEKHFIVPSGTSKTHSRRLVPIMPALDAWLSRPKGFYERAGKNGLEPLAPQVGLARRLKLAKRRTGFGVVVNGLKPPSPTLPKWPSDGLRHTFASAYIQLHPEQIAALVFSFGHAGSLDVLRRHYVGAYSPAKAREWFNVTPPGVKLPEFVVIQGGASSQVSTKAHTS